MFVNLLGNWTTVNCILIYLFPCVVVTVQGLSSITGVVNKKFCNLCNLPDLVTCLCWYLCLTLAFFTSWKNLLMFLSPHLNCASYFHTVQNETKLGERFSFYTPWAAWLSLTRTRVRRFILSPLDEKKMGKKTLEDECDQKKKKSWGQTMRAKPKLT